MNTNTRDALIEFLNAVKEFVRSDQYFTDSKILCRARDQIDIHADALINQLQSDETIIG